jgi:CBS domain-containing protein
MGMPCLALVRPCQCGYPQQPLALFNLLPGFPLDGGRLLWAVLWKRWGDLQRATARAAQWGSGIGWVLIGLGALEIFGGALIGGLWLIFIGLFLRGAASSSYQGMPIEQALGHVRVSDIMTREPVTLSPEISVAEAIEQYFLRLGHGGFPVVSDGNVLGVLSLSRVRHCKPEERAHKKVRDIILPLGPGFEIAPEASALDAIHRMNEANSGRLVVIDGGKMVGLSHAPGSRVSSRSMRSLAAMPMFWRAERRERMPELRIPGLYDQK